MRISANLAEKNIIKIYPPANGLKLEITVETLVHRG